MKRRLGSVSTHTAASDEEEGSIEVNGAPLVSISNQKRRHTAGDVLVQSLRKIKSARSNEEDEVKEDYVIYDGLRVKIPRSDSLATFGLFLSQMKKTITIPITLTSIANAHERMPPPRSSVLEVYRASLPDPYTITAFVFPCTNPAMAQNGLEAISTPTHVKSRPMPGRAEANSNATKAALMKISTKLLQCHTTINADRGVLKGRWELDASLHASETCDSLVGLNDYSE